MSKLCSNSTHWLNKNKNYTKTYLINSFNLCLVYCFECKTRYTKNHSSQHLGTLITLIEVLYE